MSSQNKSSSTNTYGKNKFLNNLLYDYISTSDSDSDNNNDNNPTHINNKAINYNLFEIVIIAFLKENNETLTTINVNNEFKQELFSFITEVLKEQKPEIQKLITQYNITS